MNIALVRFIPTDTSIPFIRMRQASSRRWFWSSPWGSISESTSAAAR